MLLRRHIHCAQRPLCSHGRGEAQALVELALVMPLPLGIIIVLFQFALLFLSYLTLVHMARDVGRWLAATRTTRRRTAA
jgi:hypothetical protein